MGGGWGRGGRLFEAGRLLTFSSFRMGAYSRWALIRGWALIRINTVPMVTAVSFSQENEGSQSPFRRRAVRQRGYSLWLLIFKWRTTKSILVR